MLDSFIYCHSKLGGHICKVGECIYCLILEVKLYLLVTKLIHQNYTKETHSEKRELFQNHDLDKDGDKLLE